MHSAFLKIANISCDSEQIIIYRSRASRSCAAMQEVLIVAGLYCLVYHLLLQGALAASTGDVRLVNVPNSTRCEGRLELKYNERFINGWFAVCDDKFGAEELQVVCRQLGCPFNNGYRTHILTYGHFPTDGIAYQRDCTGREVDLLHCNEAGSHICQDTHAEHYIGVVCNGSIGFDALHKRSEVTAYKLPVTADCCPPHDDRSLKSITWNVIALAAIAHCLCAVPQFL